MAGGAVQRRGELSVTVGAIILCAAVIVFALEQMSIAAVNGWRADELYSIWSTDPTLTFPQAYGTRFGVDPTPPLYYAALYWLRHFISLPAGQERIWAYILSACSILLASAVVVGASRRVGAAGFALTGVAAFLVSGPVLEYAPEVRAYLMAMAVVFTASWFAALAIENSSQRLPVTGWAVIGILAALTHLYAALMCGGLAAGLIMLAILGNRRDLVIPGLTLGLSASGTYGVWFFISAGPETWQAHTSITFALKDLINSLGEVRDLEVGNTIAFALLVAFLACGLVHTSTRFLTLAFSVAFALFYILPILASFKTPIPLFIFDRYWMIGGPALVVLMVFLARAGLLEGMNNKSHTMPLAIGLGIAALLLSSSATGFMSALSRTENKFIWKGAEIVAPLTHDCPAASIRVFMGKNKTAGEIKKIIEEYAQVSHTPPTVFVDANAPADTSALIRASCRVVGWAEQLLKYGNYMIGASDEDLLRLLKIDALASDVIIRRHRSGFVVLRRNP